jgi:2Fe-2S ferredoxin
MPSLIVVDRSGRESRIEAESGRSLMEILRDGGFAELLALCGGACSCATCHVQIDPDFVPLLSRMSRDEDKLLDGSPYRTDESRLSCQVIYADDLDGLRVTIAQED